MKIINEAVEAKIRDINFVEDWDKCYADRASVYTYPIYPAYSILELCDMYNCSIGIYGEYHPATWWEPEECPEVEAPEEDEIDEMAFDSWLKDFLFDNHVKYIVGKDKYIENAVQYFESEYAYDCLKDAFLDTCREDIPTFNKACADIEKYYSDKALYDYWD